MKALLASVGTRFRHRPDSEHGQAIVRLAVLFVVLVYMLVSQASGQGGHHGYGAVMLMVAAGFVIGAGILTSIAVSPGVSHIRRIIGMAADYGLMGAAMATIGEPLAWVYIILMWVTIGNGLRYGNRYLMAAVVMAVASFAPVVMFNSYWIENRVLGIGLLIGLVAVPMYLSGLLRDLTRATTEARRANEAKSRFLANMSHEFRTPLNGLSGTSELLATTRLDNEQRNYLNTIQASTRSLLSLVEDVLDISAIEAGKLRVATETFVLRELVDSIGMILQPAARTKQLAYELVIGSDVPHTLRGDPAHLRQILLNLVNNAIKFTDQGFVRIQISVADASLPEAARLRFMVADSGVGIPATARAKLFEAFEQADASLSRRFGGTGLGTTIAKGLTEAMGGTIGFESVENSGSRFWVELPFEVVTTSEPALELPAGMDTSAVAAGNATGQSENIIAFSDPFLRHRARVRPMQVLIADDHAANRMVLQSLLQKAGHRVVAVNDGESVLDAVESSDYDVIVVDLHMPGISGLDMMRQLRMMEAGSNRKTPVVVLSADVTPTSVSQCEQAGARAFIAKPIVASRLLDMLAEIASGNKANLPAQTARPQLPSCDDNLDMQVLDELRSLGMGKEFEATFVSQCLSDARNCLRLLEQHGLQESWEQVREQAHALKGVAGNVGLIKLSAAGGEIMQLPDWQVAREWRQRLNILRERLNQGVRLLEAREEARTRDVEGDGTL